jgi:hypothetical protein
MVGKARVQKRLYYKIGEACKELGIQPYVLRYWETEFPALAPSKSRSGQRVYSEKELEVIRRIKQLLYEEGYTIAGAVPRKRLPRSRRRRRLRPRHCLPLGTPGARRRSRHRLRLTRTVRTGYKRCARGLRRLSRKPATYSPF